MKKKTKIISAAVIFAAAVVFTAICVAINVVQNKKILPMETLSISKAGIDISDISLSLIANRGLSALAPEDTYFAVERAGREGFLSVEMDVRETLDGVWVLMHDDTINRMTDGRGRINRYTFYELLNFNIDNGANISQYPKTKISSLDQVLDLCGRYGIKPVINIKNGSLEGLNNMVKLLKKLDIMKLCVITSANKDYLTGIRKLSPKTELWYIVDKLTKSNMEWLAENKNFGVNFDADKKANTDKKIKQLKKGGTKLACRNVNDLETLKRIYSLGVRTFLTDNILPK